jgi:HAD superfamily hydrolase (TIGR01509 family)
MSSPIEAVVLDLGGVVCRFDPDRRLRALAQLSGLPASDIHAAVWASGLDTKADSGDLGHDEAYAAVLARLSGGKGRRGGDGGKSGNGVSPADLRAAWAAAFEPDEEVLALVRSLDRPVALFSNNGPITEDCLHRELAAVGDAFDQVLLSWRLGATKPASDAFVKATSQVGVAASAVLFVDDSITNVRAAAHAGWIAHPYRGLARLRRLFEAHELLT